MLKPLERVRLVTDVDAMYKTGATGIVMGVEIDEKSPEPMYAILIEGDEDMAHDFDFLFVYPHEVERLEPICEDCLHDAAHGVGCFCPVRDWVGEHTCTKYQQVNSDHLP